MQSPPRGVKRARSHVPESGRDISYNHVGRLDTNVGEVKGEYGSPTPDLGRFSHQTPGSTSQTPDPIFTIPSLPTQSQYHHHHAPSPQSQTSIYPEPQVAPSYTTSPPSHASSSDVRTAKTSRSSPSSVKASTSSGARNPSSSAFRNVSACNRCRLRKNRCDQLLPACRACEKAGVKCVGFDPFLGREVPRSYVYYLETRTTYLEDLLRDNGIECLSAESFALDYRPGEQQRANVTPVRPHAEAQGALGNEAQRGGMNNMNPVSKEQDTNEAEEKKLNTLVSNIGMVSVQGASDSRYLGSTSGISFARVVFAAVKSTVSRASSERGGTRPVKAAVGVAATAGGSSMRDSVFGLQTKPTFKEAPFPDKDLALKLVNLYFEHANPQLPILHRGDFMTLLERVYSLPAHKRTPREAYLLNIVFAIGSGIILDTSGSENDSGARADSAQAQPFTKKARLSTQQHQPEEYHSSAIVHLENFLGSTTAAGDSPESPGGGLEELQAVLLLAGFALLRPVAPGLWYIAGVAMRLAIDLGLHHEDASEAPGNNAGPNDMGDSKADTSQPMDGKETGRRQWVRDLRRRLWWSAYSLDRLVSFCVGRPFGITDQVVTTSFPSPLDDRYITTSGFLEVPGQALAPSAKFVAHHYFRLRLLQSEICQVLQYQSAQRVHAANSTETNEFMYTSLPSPFLSKFSSFGQWRKDVDRRLWEWKESAPSQQDSGVQFSPLFFELNYWLAVIMLYRQGLTTPAALAHGVNVLDDGIGSPGTIHAEDEGEEEFVYLKIAEAGQRVLKLYRQLHRVHLVNYTYLSTHHLFMAGISFLYAIWHSAAVRAHLSLDDVDFTVLAATSVLTDLTEKCPPAEACKTSFHNVAQAVISMACSTTGFGSDAAKHVRKPTKTPKSRPIVANRPGLVQRLPSSSTFKTDNSFSPQGRRSAPAFDMSLKDLFSQSELLNRPSNGAHEQWLPQTAQRNNHVSHSEDHGFRAGNQVGNSSSQQAFSSPNMNIDPLLQQISPQSHISQLSAQTGPHQDFGEYQNQLQNAAYPATTGFDMTFLDSFAFGPEELLDGDANMDMYGVGGLDTGVDLFDGFFFGSGGGAQNVPQSGFGNL